VPARIALASDLVRLEIVVWDRVDERLRAEHRISLPFFEAMAAVDDGPSPGVRVGDVATALGITVGGASKLVDRVTRAGFLLRRPDPDDRRASRLTLTPAGRRTLQRASTTYDAEMATLLDPALDDDEQDLLHDLLTRVLRASRRDAGAAGRPATPAVATTTAPTSPTGELR
jgi:DNA-binding MarR family transcriptional regulator